MCDVICISSSEDEDEVRTKNDKDFCTASNNDQSKKRKLSLNISGNGKSSKKFKIEEDNNESDKFDTNSLCENLSSSSSNKWYKKSVISYEYESDGSVVDFRSPKPGRSKYFDEIEKNSLEKTQSNESSKKQSSSDIESKDKKTNITKIKPGLIIKQRVSIPEESSDSIFAKFLKACSEDPRADNEMGNVIKKLQKKFDQLDSVHKDNENLRLFINKCHQKIVLKTGKLYPTMVEVKEEIKRYITKPKISKTKNKETVEKVNVEEDNTDEPVYSKEQLKKIKPLEDAIEKCEKKIKKLEKMECDWDNDEDSVYMMEDRYKKRLIQLYEKLCEITKNKVLRSKIVKKTIKLKDIKGEMTNILSVDEEIIKFINSGIRKLNKLKFKHIANPKANPAVFEIPDYIDILKIIKDQNKKLNLQLSEKHIQCLATTAFKSIATFLRKRRVFELKEQISSYASIFDDEYDQIDPAFKDPELKKRLDKNKSEGDKKLNEIFKKYVAIEAGLSKEEIIEQLKGDDSNDSEDCEMKEKRNNHTSSEDIRNDKEESKKNSDEKTEIITKQKKISEKNNPNGSNSSENKKEKIYEEKVNEHKKVQSSEKKKGDELKETMKNTIKNIKSSHKIKNSTSKGSTVAKENDKLHENSINSKDFDETLSSEIFNTKISKTIFPTKTVDDDKIHENSINSKDSDETLSSKTLNTKISKTIFPTKIVDDNKIHKNSINSKDSDETSSSKTLNTEISKTIFSTKIVDDVIHILSDDSTDFSHKTNSTSNSQEIQTDADSKKKIDNTTNLEINETLLEYPVTRDSTETEDLVLFFDSVSSDVMDKDPLEISETSKENSSSTSVKTFKEVINDDATNKNTKVDEKSSKIIESESLRSHLKNVLPVSEKFLPSTNNTLNNSTTEKHTAMNVKIITPHKNSNNCSLEKNNPQTLNTDEDKFTVLSKKNDTCNSIAVNNSSSISASSTIVQEEINDKKRTNIVKPFQLLEIEEDSELQDLSIINDQITKVTCLKSNSTSSMDLLDILVINCSEDESEPKSPDSDIILEKEVKNEAEKPLSKIKVARFASYPKSWKDNLSPEKPKQKIHLANKPTEPVLNNTPQPLEKPNSTIKSTKFSPVNIKMLNPLARPIVLKHSKNNVKNFSISSSCNKREISYTNTCKRTINNVFNTIDSGHVDNRRGISSNNDRRGYGYAIGKRRDGYSGDRRGNNNNDNRKSSGYIDDKRGNNNIGHKSGGYVGDRKGNSNISDRRNGGYFINRRGNSNIGNRSSSYADDRKSSSNFGVRKEHFNISKSRTDPRDSHLPGKFNIIPNNSNVNVIRYSTNNDYYNKRPSFFNTMNPQWKDKR